MSSSTVRAGVLCAVAFALTARAAEPRATMLHTAASNATPGEPLQIDGSLAPGRETMKKVLLRYRSPGEDWADAAMELQYGDLYRGLIPGKAVRHPAVEYYIEGVFSEGSRVALFMTASRPARVQVAKEEGGEAAEGYGKGAPEPAPEPAADNPYRTEKPEKAERDRPGKGKKGKRGKKGSIDDTPPEPAPAPEVAEKTEPKPAKEASGKDPAKEPARAEPAPEPAAAEEKEPAREKDEPLPHPKKLSAQDRADRDAARRTEREKRQQELDEELRVYAAEDPLGARVRNDREATKDPRLTQILTARQLEQLGVRTVMEALDLSQGITVSRSIQGFYRVAVRGIRGDADVLFLYDGHRLNDLYDGRALANLPIETLDRIEITRGPMPLTAGAGAVLMMVNLVPNREPGIRASFSGGSYNRPPGSPRSPLGFDGTLSGAIDLKVVKLSLDGAVWSHGGYLKRVARDALETDTIRQGKRSAGDPAGLTNDQNLKVNVGAAAELKLAALGELALKGRFLLENRAGLIGQFDSVGDDSRLAWTQVLVDLGWKKALTETAAVSARAWFDQRNARRTWQLSPREYDTNFTPSSTTSSPTYFPEGIVEETRVGERSYGVQVMAELQLPFKNTLVAGAEFEVRGVYDYAYLTNYDSLPVTTYAGAGLHVWKNARGEDQRFLVQHANGRSAIGIFVGDTWRPLELITIDAGLRLDFTQLPVSDGATGISGTAFAPFFGPRVALSFAATPALLLKLSYGRMLRTPTVQEYAETLPDSVPNQGRFIGNPALKSSITDTVEAGIDWMQGFGEARLKLRGSAFFTAIQDPIHPVDPSGNLIPYANRTSGVFVFGADGEARLDVGRMGAFVNASWFRAQDNGTPQSAHLLTDTPQVRLNIGTSLPLGPWFAFDVTLRYGAERRNNQRSTLELLRRYTLPAYAVVGAQIRTEPILEHFELAISAQNVFDLEFADDAARMDATRTPGGVPREGWGVFGTIRGWY